MPHVFQEFPKWKYHTTLPARIVASPDEEQALGAEWLDSPGLAAEEAAEDPEQRAAEMLLADLAKKKKTGKKAS
jgi:hypothetical protein